VCARAKPTGAGHPSHTTGDAVSRCRKTSLGLRAHLSLPTVPLRSPEPRQGMCCPAIVGPRRRRGLDRPPFLWGIVSNTCRLTQNPIGFFLHTPANTPVWPQRIRPDPVCPATCSSHPHGHHVGSSSRPADTLELALRSLELASSQPIVCAIMYAYFISRKTILSLKILVNLF
jgi:hypothetical protein